ncbi:MAG TPA: hypothetical protein VK964_14930 [Nocardioidaceae bacterium]|nr:hypothetical protein [Nocardioidaceae bacterium]
MPLGQGISEMWDAVRDRVEVAGHGPTWEVTAGSFESALAYARERFGDPAVLGRSDRDRWWPRVTLTVTTDPALAASAPPLEDVATPRIPAQPTRGDAADAGPSAGTEPPSNGTLPSSLEAIFAHQEAQRRARANNEQYS